MPEPAPPARPSPGASDATTAAASEAAGSARLPARVGRYEVTALLGEGAFGRVYRGFDPKLGRDVAVKVPHPAALTPDLRERFLREARAAAAIHHPNVCPIYDVETDGDLPYLVMRFVPGGTLAGVLEKRAKPFPASEAAAVVRKLALGVAAAHARGVLHRDLKPANVLWDNAAREVLVTDFGLARLAGSAQLSRTGDILGTPAYMSPEQARARQDEVGPPTDVYSLGVILYRLVTGGVPFDGTVMEVLARAQFDDPRRPSEVRPGLDPAVDGLCTRAMARRPGDRYQSAKDFADALGGYLRATAPDGGTPASDLAIDLVTGTGSASLPLPPHLSAPQRRGQDVFGAEPVLELPPPPRVVRLPVVLACLFGLGVLVAGGVGVALSSRQPTTTGDEGAPDAGRDAVPTLPANPKVGEAFAVRVGDPPVGMEFRWIPPGSFPMGSTHPKGFPDERPVRRVTISRGFWVGRTEVTQAQWKAVVGTEPSLYRGAHRPVEQVSWDDARQYCRRLTNLLRNRATVRLPTEAEWEYATRAGTTTEYWFGNQLDARVANYGAEGTWNGSPKGPFRKQTTDVGSFPANPWGLCDVHGNVWEWCADWYGPYPAGDVIDPTGAPAGTQRVLRGGYWGDNPSHCRSAFRGKIEPPNRTHGVGFRVCLGPG